MNIWTDITELFEMFGVDRRSRGAQDMVTLVTVSALMANFPEYGLTVGDVARYLMRQRKVSSLVFWSNIKAALRPIFEADNDTLRALGLDLGDGEKLTGSLLAALAAAKLAPMVTTDVMDRQCAMRIVNLCRGKG